MLSDTMKIDRRSVKMIAHRGVSGLERENTNAAFVAAGNRSYFGIETDIHKTADGRFAVIHDEFTGRVSGDANINVEESDWQQIRQISLPDLDGTRVRSDLRIPELAEYVNICKKYQKKGVLELKSSFTPGELQEIVQIIKDLGYLDGIIFISFLEEDVRGMRQILPQQPIQLLAGQIDEKVLNLLAECQLDLDVQYGCLTEELIEQLHHDGVRVNCWTCDDPDTAKKLIDWGVDFITTNILE